MTSVELKVAQAAIKVKPKLTIPELWNDISAQTGISRADVEKILSDLINESFLKLSVTPASNLAAGEQVGSTARAWYGKGQLWKTYAEHGDFNGLHFETRHMHDKWEWEIIDQNKTRLHGGLCETLEEAKTAAEKAAGGKPEWTPIGAEVERKPAR